MPFVWKKLQRLNQRAAKYQFVTSYQELVVVITPNWTPNKLCVVWSRKRRRIVTEPLEWKTMLSSPFRGSTVWDVPENKEAAITLFHDPNSSDFEDKYWSFSIEDVSLSGKHRKIACADINMKVFASIIPQQKELNIKLKPVSKKIVEADLKLTMSCKLIKEGKATDEDMQSIASLMSFNSLNSIDVGNMDDFKEEKDTNEATTASKILKIVSQFDFCDYAVDKPSLMDSNQDCLMDNMSQVQSSEGKLELLGEFSLNDQVFVSPQEIKSDQGDFYRNLEKGTEYHREGINDLMEWCKGITKGYKGVHITNMTTSWRNGLGFCAIINHFLPDAIDFDKLDPANITENCKTAFDITERLGIPKVIEHSDMTTLSVPDKLAVITYLYQIKAVFTCENVDNSNLCISDHKLGLPILSILPGHKNSQLNDMTKLSDIDQGTTDSMVVDSPNPTVRVKDQIDNFQNQNCVSKATDILTIECLNSTDQASDCTVPNAKNKKLKNDAFSTISKLILSRKHKLFPQSNTLKENSLSYTSSKIVEPHLPTMELSSKNSALNKSAKLRPMLMTRKQLMNPFDSDSEEEREMLENEGCFAGNASQLKETKNLLHSPKSQIDHSSSDNQSILLPIIADEVVDPDHTVSMLSYDLSNIEVPEILDLSLVKNKKSYEETSLKVNASDKHKWHKKKQWQLREKAKQLISETRKDLKTDSGNLLLSSPTFMKNINYNQEVSKDYEESERESSVQRSSCKPNSKNENRNLHNSLENSHYINMELRSLSEKQKEIDQEASVLEKKLRLAMKANNDVLEDKLMKKWFLLVNDKNVLLQRQMQLNILERENNLEKRYEFLSEELRKILEIEEWQKTEALKIREKLLLEELVHIVNKRDKIVQDIHTQEKLMEEQQLVSEETQNSLLREEKSCIVQ